MSQVNLKRKHAQRIETNMNDHRRVVMNAIMRGATQDIKEVLVKASTTSLEWHELQPRSISYLQRKNVWHLFDLREGQILPEDLNDLEEEEFPIKIFMKIWMKKYPTAKSTMKQHNVH
jgi:hypothetical protein